MKYLYKKDELWMNKDYDQKSRQAEKSSDENHSQKYSKKSASKSTL